MSEETKKERTITDIQGEYQGLCTRAGHVQYQLYALQKDMDTINNQLRDLNLEAASVQAKAQEAAKVAPTSEATPNV